MVVVVVVADGGVRALKFSGAPGSRPSRRMRSVVACVLLPLRERSHSMSRRVNCGNMLATVSMADGGTRERVARGCEEEEGLAELLLLGGLKKK